MRDALALAGCWIVAAAAGLVMLVLAGCGNWPQRCPHGVRVIDTDGGPYYICKPKGAT